MIPNRSLANHSLTEYQKTPYLFIKQLAIVYVTPGGDYEKLRRYFVDTFPDEDLYDHFERYAVFVASFLLGMGQYQTKEILQNYYDNYTYVLDHVVGGKRTKKHICADEFIYFYIFNVYCYGDHTSMTITDEEVDTLLQYLTYELHIPYDQAIDKLRKFWIQVGTFAMYLKPYLSAQQAQIMIREKRKLQKVSPAKNLRATV